MADQLGHLTLTLDARQVSRDAALRTAYWFTRDLFVEFPPSQAEHTFDVVLRLRNPEPTLGQPKPRVLADLAAEFQNALIDFELRIRVQKETTGVRELILAKAFAESGVLEEDPPGSFFDPVLSSDPGASRRLVVLTPKER